jgi:hypothetical protein
MIVTRLAVTQSLPRVHSGGVDTDLPTTPARKCNDQKKGGEFKPAHWIHYSLACYKH